MDPRERAVAAMHGLAVGDALGMPTQTFSRREIARRWPRLSGFVDAPHDQPLAPGLPAGHVTDDTAQALLLGRRWVDDRGSLDARRWADDLLAWQHRMAAAGSLDLLGPSTSAAVAAIAAGADPATTGRTGTTNGAAMRITPVAIAVAPEPLRLLVDAVVAADRPTHDTAPAHAGAAAVAAAVSAGVEGAALPEALALGVAAARLAAGHGQPATHGTDVAAAIEAALDLVRRASHVDHAIGAVARDVGTGLATHESVPAALALAALHGEDAWAAGLAGATIGGDTDTIAAIACAVSAACGGRLPAAAVATVVAVNALDLGRLVDGLLALREGRSA